MSRRIDLPLLGKNQLVEMARQHKKKKSKAVVGSSGEDAQAAVDVAPPPPPTFSRSKKRDASIDLTSLSDQTTLTFPSSACAHSDFGPISSEAQKLLFEEDQLVLQRMGTRSVAIAHYQAAFTVSLASFACQFLHLYCLARVSYHYFVNRKCRRPPTC